jgi:hypothetical protein
MSESGYPKPPDFGDALKGSGGPEVPQYDDGLDLGSRPNTSGFPDVVEPVFDDNDDDLKIGTLSDAPKEKYLEDLSNIRCRLVICPPYTFVPFYKHPFL